MSAAEDDTELRDLLIQNLENNGVLNKLKAEMRAAVFLAMEEQDKLENKSPLINENLKNCLNSKDGRLAASLIVDFLQVFNLDFTLAVFQPEINSLNCLDSRDVVCRELGLSEFQANKNSPLLLELIRAGHDKSSVCTEGNRHGNISKEPSQKQIMNAHMKFDSYDKDRTGCILKEDLKRVFMELFPSLNKSMLETFITDELQSADNSFCQTVDFQLFLRIYKCLFTQCRDVVLLDTGLGENQMSFPEDKISSAPLSKIPRYKGQKHRGQSQAAAQEPERVTSLDKGNFQEQASDTRNSFPAQQRERLDLSLEVEDDLDDGDSFFDDPLPKPQKTYGCRGSPFGDKDSPEKRDSQKDVVSVREESLCGSIISSLRRDKSLNDLSLLAGDSQGDREDLSEHLHVSGFRKVEASGTKDSPAGSMSDGPKPGGGGSSASDHSHSRNAALNSREKGIKAGSLHPDEDVEYDDDFNSHRSDFSKSELSIGEEIEEVSIEGPDNSDKFDETTEDLSVSQLSQSHGADYMEDVA